MTQNKHFNVKPEKTFSSSSGPVLDEESHTSESEISCKKMKGRGEKDDNTAEQSISCAEEKPGWPLLLLATMLLSMKEMS